MPYGEDEYFDEEMEDAGIGYSSPSDDEGVDEHAEEMFRNPSLRAQEEPFGSFYFGSYASSPCKRDGSDSAMQAGHEAHTDIKDGLAGLTEDDLAALTEEELIWLVFDKERQKQQDGAQELQPSGGQTPNDALTSSTPNIVTRTQVATISSQLPNGPNTSTDMPLQNTANAIPKSAEGEGVSLPAATPNPLSTPALAPDNGRMKKPSGAGHGRYKRRDNHSRRENRHRATSHRVKSGPVDKGRGRVNNGGGRPKRNRNAAALTQARFSNVSLESRVSFLPLERRVTCGEARSPAIERGPPSYRRPCRYEDKGRQCKKADCKFLHRNQVGPFRGLLFSLPWSSK